MGNQKKAVCTIGIAAVNVIVFLLLSFFRRENRRWDVYVGTWSNVCPVCSGI